MKTERLSAIRAAAVLLAGLLAAGHPAAGQITFKYHLGKSTAREAPSKTLAGALAQQVKEVKKRFETNLQVPNPPSIPGHEPTFSRQEVAGLITRTGEDLDQAIQQIREPGLDALRAWSAAELRRIQEELAAQPGQNAAWLPRLSTPRAIAVIASLGRLPLGLASVNAAAVQQGTVSAETFNRLVSEVGTVVNRILFLAEHDDLEVKIWVGSTVPHTMFSFWSQGRITGTAPASMIIRTDGTKTVLRGLYAYKATYAEGPVTELVQYPNPDGASAAQTPSERLDLVNGSSFFCCRFKESYCHHVDSDKECRP